MRAYSATQNKQDTPIFLFRFWSVQPKPLVLCISYVPHFKALSAPWDKGLSLFFHNFLFYCPNTIFGPWEALLTFIICAKSAFKGPKIKVKVRLYQKIPQQVSLFYSKMASFQRNISHRAAPSSNLEQYLS